MLKQEWMHILLLFLLLILVSVLKWRKQMKGQHATLSQVLRHISVIVFISLALVVLIGLPMLHQPRATNIIILRAGVLLILVGALLNILVARQFAHMKFQMTGLGIPDRLVTTGLFGFIRHPSSFGVMCILTGWYMAWRALYCLYFAVPIMLFAIFIENRFEERNLERRFGEEYRAYKKRVGMYFPKTGRKGMVGR